MTQETEGGYKITRARTTRPPRRTFTTGWELLSNQEKKTLLDFQKSVGVTNIPFTWEHPVDGEVFIVRFIERIQFSYIKYTKSWEARSVGLIEA